VNHKDGARPWSRAARARPPTSRYAALAARRGTVASLHPSSTLASLTWNGLPGLGRGGCGAIAARGGRVDQVEHRLPRCSGGGCLISLSARFGPQRRHVAHGVPPVLVDANRKLRAAQRDSGVSVAPAWSGVGGHSPRPWRAVSQRSGGWGGTARSRRVGPRRGRARQSAQAAPHPCAARRTSAKQRPRARPRHSCTSEPPRQARDP
jgi:hypothetical protein